MPTFTNKATLSYNGRTTDSNTVTGNYAEALSLTKTALDTLYTASDKITYTVSVINQATSALTEVTLTDDLGGITFGGGTVYPLSYVEGTLLYFLNGALEATPTISSVSPLVIEGLSIPAGGNAIFVYEAQVTEYAPLDVNGSIINTVTVSSPALISDFTDTETVNTADAPELSIVKSLCPQTVTENGTVTYTFDIINVGNTAAVATDNVTVTDLFDPVLTISSVTVNGTPISSGTGYTYNSVTGIFETVAGVITVPAATYTQNPDGSYNVIPGSTVIKVVGTI